MMKIPQQTNDPKTMKNDINPPIGNWHEPNWDREKPSRFWDPGKKLLRCIRKYQHLQNSRNIILIIRKKYYVLLYKFWSIVAGADIPLNCKIEGGLLTPHPNGIVIHPSARIGANCLIFQQVTIAGAVVVGHHVDIGAGAKILGPLKIGNNVKIGANAVVTKDIESGSTVVGIPAYPI